MGLPRKPSSRSSRPGFSAAGASRAQTSGTEQASPRAVSAYILRQHRLVNRTEYKRRKLQLQLGLVRAAQQGHAVAGRGAAPHKAPRRRRTAREDGLRIYDAAVFEILEGPVIERGMVRPVVAVGERHADEPSSRPSRGS